MESCGTRGPRRRKDALGFRPAIFAGFSELGYVSGKSAIFEERYANEEAERFHSLAAELVRLKVDVLVAVTFPSASAAQRATSTIPVVFVGPSDPVGLKLVASLALPGGNLTGLSALATDLTAKRVELVKEAIPGVSRVALIYDPGVPNFKFEISESGTAAERLALSFEAFEARNAHDLEHVFAQLAGRGFGAVILGISPVISRKKLSACSSASRDGLDGPIRRGGCLDVLRAELAHAISRRPALRRQNPKGRKPCRDASGAADEFLSGLQPKDSKDDRS
ncbi:MULTISPECIES: ABC transporter substrate-binding protein [unclassified Bradyrhizobium]|uniref:ABC transporter substrate-binding protein n=1 Tax=unclassified Bradyrhizobium TaxID=2631580 RepID=UPI002449B30E|nr:MULTISPECIES: ABC transporter substrate-binding protein [unclassified Bradyrhizobium]MDH2345846.1 ABC transporter substrate-binding protein [Bradyrhizobium sp. SSUT77]MDH2354054.1 ABC transporter substrate-binding protein [Bradyrhizobium sp. SSUT112]